MRWPLYLLLVLAAWASIGVAQDAAALKAIGSLPSCAVSNNIQHGPNDISLIVLAIVPGDSCS